MRAGIPVARRFVWWTAKRNWRSLGWREDAYGRVFDLGPLSFYPHGR